MIIVNMSGEESKRYRITADYKNCTYQRETWSRTISTDKQVKIHVTGCYRWGTFYVEINDTEKAELMEKDSVDLSNYVYEVDNLIGSGWNDNEVEIVNASKYSDEEMREIYQSIYISEEMQEEGITYDTNEEYPIDTDILEDNNWELDDTQYGFTSGCILTNEDDEDDEQYESE